MTTLAEAIATDLMAQNMLDVSILTAAKVISGTLDRYVPVGDRERAIQEAVAGAYKDAAEYVNSADDRESCARGLLERGPTDAQAVLDSLIERAIERCAQIAEQEFVSYHDAANKIRAIPPASIRERESRCRQMRSQRMRP